MRALKYHQRRESGVSMVEAAIVLPILILLVFGLIEYGFYYQARHQLEAAAQAAVEHAVKLPELMNDNYTEDNTGLDDVRAEVSRAAMARLGEGMLGVGEQGSGETIEIEPLSVANCVTSTCRSSRETYEAVVLRAGEYATGDDDFIFMHPAACTPDSEIPCGVNAAARLDPSISYVAALRNNPVVVVLAARRKSFFHIPGLSGSRIVATAFSFPQKFTLPPSGKAVQCDIVNNPADKQACSAFCNANGGGSKCCAGCPTQPGQPFMCKPCCNASGNDDNAACKTWAINPQNFPGQSRVPCNGWCENWRFSGEAGVGPNSNDCSVSYCCSADDTATCQATCSSQGKCYNGCSVPNGNAATPTCNCTACGCTADERQSCESYCNSQTDDLGFHLCARTCNSSGGGAFDPANPSLCQCGGCTCTPTDKAACRANCAAQGQCCDESNCGHCKDCDGAGA